MAPAKYPCLEVVLDKLCIILELDSSMVFMYHSFFFVSLAPLVPISPLIMLIAHGHLLASATKDV